MCIRDRLFLDYDAQDFLTYSFMEKKWRTAMLHNLPQQGFGISDAQISSRDSAVIGQYLHSKWEAIASIREFQEEIREKQLLARHKKETDPWDAAMALVPPLPKGFRVLIKNRLPVLRHVPLYVATPVHYLATYISCLLYTSKHPCNLKDNHLVVAL